MPRTRGEVFATDLPILHLDMDAFFAAVEQRDNPRLLGKPVVVGGMPNSRGVVATASYEARRFGVHSAMPSREALRLCPRAVFVRPNLAKYQQVSAQIRAIMGRYTQRIEPLSLDEAFLDVAGQDGVVVGRALKEAIRRELDLTASVGVSFNTFLAKLASDLEKPDGFTVVDEARAAALLPGLPVRRLWGVGPRSEEALHALGIKTFSDLLLADRALLVRTFGRRADELLLLARGVDTRPVATSHEIKSIGEENTFAVDQTAAAPLAELLEQYAGLLAARLERHGLRARTVTVKIRWHDFRTITRSQSSPEPTSDPAALAAAAREIFHRVDWQGRRIRLLGLAVSNFSRQGDLIQLRLRL